jgi:hypothetical protein
MLTLLQSTDRGDIHHRKTLRHLQTISRLRRASEEGNRPLACEGGSRFVLPSPDYFGQLWPNVERRITPIAIRPKRAPESEGRSVAAVGQKPYSRAGAAARWRFQSTRD